MGRSFIGCIIAGSFALFGLGFPLAGNAIRLKQGPMRLDGVLKWEKCECVGRQTKWVRQGDIKDSEVIDVEYMGLASDLEREFNLKYKQLEKDLIKAMYDKLKR